MRIGPDRGVGERGAGFEYWRGEEQSPDREVKKSRVRIVSWREEQSPDTGVERGARIVKY